MDDPSRRGPPPPPEGAISPYAAPPGPYPPVAYPVAYPPQPYAPVVQPLPGMPPVHMPGVTVTIQNVVVPPQPMMVPQAYPQPAPYPPQQMSRGVVDMMTDDAGHRAREAVAKRGPTRVLAYVAGTGAAVLAAFLLLMIAFGAHVGAVLAAATPLLLVSAGAFVIGARAGQGVASHHLEQAILRLAAENRGTVRVVALAQSTGRPLRECQTAIDAMVSSGHATIEADEGGGLVYRVPDLEPRRALPATTEIVAEPYQGDR